MNSTRIRPFLKLTGWLSDDVGTSVPALELEAQPMGSCMVTYARRL